MRSRTFLSVIFFALLLLVGGFLFLGPDSKEPAFYEPIMDFSAMNVHENVYEDATHRFRINYPSYLTPSFFINEEHYIVSFIMGIDIYEIGVTVSTTTALSAHDWVEQFNRRHTGFPPHTGKLRIKREAIIGGIPGVVTYPYSDFQGQVEEFPYDERALIVKDGKLFDIGASRTSDPEKTLNSFSFF